MATKTSTMVNGTLVTHVVLSVTLDVSLYPMPSFVSHILSYVMFEVCLPLVKTDLYSEFTAAVHENPLSPLVGDP